MNNTQETVWIFHAAGAQFSGAVFDEIGLAEQWIAKHNLTGVLTKYPMNCGAYEWAVENEIFEPKTERHSTPKFIGGFTSASQEHFHYEDGTKA